MFLFGIVVGVVLTQLPHLMRTVPKVHGVLGRWSDTCAFFGRATSVWLEQTCKRSLVYSREKKAFVLSFWLKGKLHCVYVRPPTGPMARHADPFERGYAAVINER